ncbi:hypothetical protein G7066_09625 [Leucobacter coleopterorum]|uniref:HTH luxR-type domain-containing protein n=1 Tax=Leucobacter coleopterorum TaxID=2714933 RepID=A0ABX6JWV3_9MICO|nr:helix-turn-helix transcriptional regulator [Leucobacter coleopterorum]QIM18792.1 hypothetical protein G7066_09625 [Leucobacter coleopterorum]
MRVQDQWDYGQGKRRSFSMKRERMLVGRELELGRAFELVQAGISLDIVGNRGSGRSTFMLALRQYLESEGWVVIQVRGIASLQKHSLGALHLAGIGASIPNSTSLHAAAEALKEATSRDKSTLFLDDWDDLDETSWGIAESIRRTTGVPLVLSRLQGLRARHTPSGLAAATMEPTYDIDMSPLTFDHMEQAIENYLGDSIEGSTMSRIFAKSGGNIGLAVSLVDATTREGSLVFREDRMEWVAVRDLWSPGLRTVLEGYLEGLSPAARDALEIIAIVGVAGISSVRRLVDWDTLELLEELTLIAFIPSDPEQLVTVVPPLLVEYFRHEPLGARQIRLTELIIDRLGTAVSSSAILAERTIQRGLGRSPEALLVRLLHENLRTRRIVASIEWESAPTAANAIRYFNTLVQTHTIAVSETVDRVFAETDLTSADDAEKAIFAVSRARWIAYGKRDVATAISSLHLIHPSSLGVFGKMLEVAEVEIAVTTQGIPEGFEERLDVEDDAPTEIRCAAWETRLLIMVSSARYQEAKRVFGQLARSGLPTPTARVLLALALLGEGHQREALENILRGFDEAKGALDFEGIRIFGVAAALCHIYSGDYSNMDHLLKTLHAVGDPTPFPAGTQLTLYVVSALLAARRGDVAACERLAAEVERTNVPDGPLLGQSRVWMHVLRHMVNGESKSAPELLWDSSTALWARGAKGAALVGFLVSAELDPNNERLDYLKRILQEVPEAVGPQAQLRYLFALRSENVEELLLSAKDLEAAGRIGLALKASQAAKEIANKNENDKQCQAAEDLSGSIRARHGGGAFDVARFGPSAALLSDREKEVAHFVASGFSNQEIATQLVVSVRTVEGHVYRILRKLNLSNRQSLRNHLSDVHL